MTQTGRQNAQPSCRRGGPYVDRSEVRCRQPAPAWGTWRRKPASLQRYGTPARPPRCRCHGGASNLEGLSRDRGAGLPGGAACGGLDRRPRSIPHPQSRDRAPGASGLRRRGNRKRGGAGGSGQGIRDRQRALGGAGAGGDRRRGAGERQNASSRGVRAVRRGRHALPRPALLPDPGGSECRDGVRSDPRRACQGQGGGGGADGSVPAGAQRADPSQRRGADRAYARVRARGAGCGEGVRRRRGAGDRQGDDRPRRAHHQDQAGQVRSVEVRGPLR